METSPPPPQKSQPRLNIVASASSENQQHNRACRTPPSRSSAPVEIKPFFKSLDWSLDGTTVIASSSDERICSYVLPQDLLEPRQAAFKLSPQGVLTLPEPTRAIAPCPYYSLSHPWTQTVLVACQDHPLQLYSAFPNGLSEESLQHYDTDGDSGGDCDGDRSQEESMRQSPAPRSSSPNPSSLSSCSSSSISSSSSSSSSSSAFSQTPQSQHKPPIASYTLIKRETEAYITCLSLIWPAPGTHFIAGAGNLIAYFDASRTGEGPALRIPTIPSARHIAKGGGVGMKGTVSALAAQPDTGLVAAGTWTRWVGLYDLARAGSCVANWSLSSGEPRGAGGAGGVMQTIWSPCGRYLVLNERRSTSLAVYDVRVTGRLLSRLVGRDANTNQRLSCDVFSSSAAASADSSMFEVWAGTRDGRVLVWDSVGGHAGDGEECLSPPTWEWQAHGVGSAVGSAALHTSGSVLATCAGSWEVAAEDSDSDDSDADDGPARRVRGSTIRTSADTSLRIWSIGSEEAAPSEQLS